MSGLSRREFIEKAVATGGAAFLAGCGLNGASLTENGTPSRGPKPKGGEKPEPKPEGGTAAKTDTEHNKPPVVLRKKEGDVKKAASSETWIIHHPDCRKHDTGPTHPERPARVIELEKALRAADAPKGLRFVKAREATLNEIRTVHKRGYVERVRALCARGGRLDPDTPVMKDSWRAALLAAGGGLLAVDAVLDGRAKNAFAVIRPPGHHSFPNHGMGFCVFNNVALAAVHALKRKEIERVLIVDWDLHHGNGTQEIFWEDGRVLFFSTHAFPFYPGTGKASERGAGKGKGLIVNAPLAVGSGDDKVLDAFHKKLLPAADRFRPQLLLVSCGFDGHRLDPMRGLRFSTACFVKLSRLVLNLADRHCGGKVVSLLEGGYSLQALREAGKAHVKELAAAGGKNSRKA